MLFAYLLDYLYTPPHLSQSQRRDGSRLRSGDVPVPRSRLHFPRSPPTPRIVYNSFRASASRPGTLHRCRDIGTELAAQGKIVVDASTNKSVGIYMIRVQHRPSYGGTLVNCCIAWRHAHLIRSSPVWLVYVPRQASLSRSEISFWVLNRRRQCMGAPTKVERSKAIHEPGRPYFRLRSCDYYVQHVYGYGLWPSYYHARKAMNTVEERVGDDLRVRADLNVYERELRGILV
jgi:hypothetical protein